MGHEELDRSSYAKRVDKLHAKLSAAERERDYWHGVAEKRKHRIIAQAERIHALNAELQAVSDECAMHERDGRIAELKAKLDQCMESYADAKSDRDSWKAKYTALVEYREKVACDCDCCEYREKLEKAERKLDEEAKLARFYRALMAGADEREEKLLAGISGVYGDILDGTLKYPRERITGYLDDHHSIGESVLLDVRDRLEELL